METLAPITPIQDDFRAQLHQVIDQIQDEAALQAALLLLLPQAVSGVAFAPDLTPGWQTEVDKRLTLAAKQLDAGEGLAFTDVMERLRAGEAA